MNKLEKLRNKIDDLDAELLEILAQRMSVVKEVGEYKKKHGTPPLQPGRKQQVMDLWSNNAKELGMSEEFALNFFEVIHDYALELENIESLKRNK